MKRLIVAAVVLASLALASQPAWGGKVSGRTLSLEEEELVGVRIEAFGVSENGVVDVVPFKTEFSKAKGKYEIDLGAARRVVLRYFRADRNDTRLPEPPAAVSGGLFLV